MYIIIVKGQSSLYIIQLYPPQRRRCSLVLSDASIWVLFLHIAIRGVAMEKFLIYNFCLGNNFYPHLKDYLQDFPPPFMNALSFFPMQNL